MSDDRCGACGLIDYHSVWCERRTKDERIIAGKGDDEGRFWIRMGTELGGWTWDRAQATRFSTPSVAQRAIERAEIEAEVAPTEETT